MLTHLLVLLSVYGGAVGAQDASHTISELETGGILLAPGNEVQLSFSFVSETRSSLLFPDEQANFMIEELETSTEHDPTTQTDIKSIAVKIRAKSPYSAERANPSYLQIAGTDINIPIAVNP